MRSAAHLGMDSPARPHCRSQLTPDARGGHHEPVRCSFVSLSYGWC